MNKAAEILSDINTFLVSHNVDKEVIEFFLELKTKVLDLDEQKLYNHKRSKELSQVEVLLRSIGKRAFVSCYYIFKQVAEGTIENTTDAIKDCSGAKKNSSRRTKASVGVRLFKLGLQIEALNTIVEAEKVEQAVKEKALEILKKEEN